MSDDVFESLYAKYVIRDEETGYYVIRYSSVSGGPKSYATRFTKSDAVKFIGDSVNHSYVIKDAE